MTKIIIASHHKLADGLKDTLNYILPSSPDIISMPMYLDNEPIDKKVESALKNINENEKVIVFTDMLGGSVNQEFSKYANEQIHVITGVNLPILLTIALVAQNGDVSVNQIKEAITESRNQLLYVNEIISSQEMDDLDE
ncbi:PTS sugar transporter subunit IIA [Streptococcus pluranimalium]|uniref:PTS sugar transporter subunit IIA n=1 Tax=Streptococcus pluranimalium TaxID=82348 RepID=UPI003F671AAB